MSYTIPVRIHQSISGDLPRFTIVEKTVYVNGGNWSDTGDAQVLTMNSSGTSGTLRFSNGYGGFVLFILGMHNYAPWTDIATNLSSNDTSVALQPQWYGSGSKAHSKNWADTRGTVATDAKGYTFGIVVTGSGTDLKADIFIQG